MTSSCITSTGMCRLFHLNMKLGGAGHFWAAGRQWRLLALGVYHHGSLAPLELTQASILQMGKFESTRSRVNGTRPSGSVGDKARPWIHTPGFLLS